MPRVQLVIREELPSHHLAKAVLAEIADFGVDGVRVHRLAERMGFGMGRLYRRWRSRELCLEETWRHVMAGFDQEVGRAFVVVGPSWHAFDDVWENLLHALPEQFSAFLELHAARRRWLRGDEESDGIILPSLVRYIDVAQHLGHLRLGPVRAMAAVVWWTLAGCATGPERFDRHRRDWCFQALKRMLLTPAALALDEVPVDVDEDGSVGDL